MQHCKQLFCFNKPNNNYTYFIFGATSYIFTYKLPFYYPKSLTPPLKENKPARISEPKFSKYLVNSY